MQPTHHIPLKRVTQSTRLQSSTDPVWSKFYSHEIPASLILNAIHLEQLQLLKKRITSRMGEEDPSGMNLQIRGQEVPNQSIGKQLPEVILRNRTLYNSNIKKIRAFLSNQQNNVLQGLTNREEATDFREKIEQLKKFRQKREAREARTATKETSPTRTEQKDSLEPIETNETIERMIMGTPILFNRIVTAYNKQKYDAAREAANHSLKSKPRTTDKRRSVPCVIESDSLINPDLMKLQKFKEMNFLLALSNNLMVNLPVETIQTYKAYVCKGNNGILVKGLLKCRPWWSIAGHNQVATCNLTWTEWRRTKSFQLLKTADQRQFDQQCNKSQLAAKRNEKTQMVSKLVRLEQYPTLRQAIRPQQLISVFSFSKKLTESTKPSDYVQRYCPQHRFLSTVDNPHGEMLLNHFQGGLHLHSKKLLYLNLKEYYRAQQKDVWDVLPITYIVRNGCGDPQFMAFSEHYRQIQQQQPIRQRPETRRAHNIWICKPGQNSNRGNGIYLHDNLQEIKGLVKAREGSSRSLIIQKYIDYPFLYQRRKFDLRCYLLLTSYNGILKGYWFDEGYIRTSSRQFTLKHLDNRIIHLTNDAIQKRSDQYGKFESSNKISLADFQKYLDTEHPSEKYSVAEVFARMKDIAGDIVRSVEHVLNPNNRQYCFQLFGLDFMIDSRFRPLLIEANSNPCLQISGLVLGRLIPQLIENVLRIAVDPLFPPPDSAIKNSKKMNNLATLDTNKFELIFDQQFEASVNGASTQLISQADLEDNEEEKE